MPRPRFLSRRKTWDTPEIKLLSGDSKSRRRRLFNRLTRFASSPALNKTDQLPSSDRPTPKPSISCISLSSRSLAEGSGEMSSEPRLFRLRSASESSLDLFVDCEDGIEPTQEKKPGIQWSGLPDEVKVKVLSYLEPRELVLCSAVSKEFDRLCHDGQLWQTLDASEFYNCIPVEQLSQLIVQAGNFVRHLNLRGCVQLQKDWRVQAVANACRNLVSASLEGCKFERPTVHFIIMRNPRLVNVNLSGLPAVTNSTCRLLADSCPLIETLNVSFCTNANAHGLKRVVRACRNLRELNACELAINDDGFMQALFASNTVEKLHLGDSIGITDEHIRLLVEGVDPVVDPFTDRNTAPPRKLKHLDLGKCTFLTDNALRYLAGNVPHLDRLELGGVASLTDAGFAHLIPTVPKLSYLDIEECPELTDRTLVHIAQSPAAKRLTHLQVSYCESMGDFGMMELLRKCERLRNLEMDNTRISDLTLVEATRVIRERPAHSTVTTRPASHVALRLVVFDCPVVTWTGIRKVLSRNSEHMKKDLDKPGVLLLKCFHEHQRTVDEHTKLVLRRELEKADFLEKSWVDYMIQEDAGAGMRRRARRNANVWDQGGARRGRGGVCAIM